MNRSTHSDIPRTNNNETTSPNKDESNYFNSLDNEKVVETIKNLKHSSKGGIEYWLPRFINWVARKFKIEDLTLSEKSVVSWFNSSYQNAIIKNISLKEQKFTLKMIAGILNSPKYLEFFKNNPIGIKCFVDMVKLYLRISNEYSNVSWFYIPTSIKEKENDLSIIKEKENDLSIIKEKKDCLEKLLLDQDLSFNVKLQFLSLDEISKKSVADIFSEMKVEDAADIFGRMPTDSAVGFLGEIRIERAIDVLSKMPIESSADFLSEMPIENLATILEKISKVDLVIKILNNLDESKINERSYIIARLMGQQDYGTEKIIKTLKKLNYKINWRTVLLFCMKARRCIESSDLKVISFILRFMLMSQKCASQDFKNLQLSEKYFNNLKDVKILSEDEICQVEKFLRA